MKNKYEYNNYWEMGMDTFLPFLCFLALTHQMRFKCRGEGIPLTQTRSWPADIPPASWEGVVISISSDPSDLTDILSMDKLVIFMALAFPNSALPSNLPRNLAVPDWLCTGLGFCLLSSSAIFGLINFRFAYVLDKSCS